MTLDLKSVFKSLNEKVRYAHFKSNMHLDASLKGETDFDILVDRRDQEAFVKIMYENNFVRMDTASVNEYEGVEDWIIFSDQYLRLIHFHIHWEFVVGQPHVKQYCLPLTKIILSNLIIRNIDGVTIKCVTPHLELEILIIRSYLKFRKRDLLRYLVSRKILAPDLDTEFDWLLTQTKEANFDDQKLEFSSLRILNSITLIKSNKILKYLFWVWFLRYEYRNFRTLSPLQALRKRYWNEFQKRIVSKLSKQRNALKRTPHAGGIAMHFVGIDGAGKSTIQHKMHSMLCNKIDVANIYFGIGCGKKSWHRALLELFSSKNKNAKSQTIKVQKTTKLNFIRKFKRSIYALSIAMEKRSKLRKLQKLRSKGFLVLCDRYPQSLVERSNDGFILDNENFNYGFWRLVYNFERKIMNSFEHYCCDILFFLDISAKNAYARKEEEAVEVLEQKSENLKLIIERDARARDTVILDAMGSPHVLVNNVVSAIWPYLK